MTAPSDWWKDFFSGPWLEVWRRCTPEETTSAEVDFIEKELGLRAPARVLDVPSGNGRHTLELALRGHLPTGVELAAEYVAEARAASAERKLPAVWEHREMRDLPWRDEFDAAFSYGNSFGYLDDDGNQDFLKALHRVLKPGGRLLLDVPTVAECLLRTFQERSWYPLGDILYLIERSYDPVRGRMDAEHTCIHNGKVERRSLTQRVYMYRELLRLLDEAGFSSPTAYGGLNSEPFRFGSPRLFLIATKQG